MSKNAQPFTPLDEILKFSITRNLTRSPINGAMQISQRLRGKGKKHAAIFHFMGRPAQIRACERWVLYGQSNPTVNDKGVVEHHFKCVPTEQTATVDTFSLQNGQIDFRRTTRRNAGRPNQGAKCRRTPVMA